DEARAGERMAAQHFRHLFRMHEEAPYLGRLVSASEPSLDAHVGAPARAPALKDGGEVAGGEAHQRVIDAEGRHDDFTHFAFGDRIARPGTHDLDDKLLV